MPNTGLVWFFDFEENVSCHNSVCKVSAVDSVVRITQYVFITETSLN
jgi:hypothetical protein